MVDELIQNAAKVNFAERNQVIQTLTADGSDQPFAEGIGLRCTLGSEQRTNPEGLQCLVEVW